MGLGRSRDVLPVARSWCSFARLLIPCAKHCEAVADAISSYVTRHHLLLPCCRFPRCLFARAPLDVYRKAEALARRERRQNIFVCKKTAVYRDFCVFHVKQQMFFLHILPLFCCSFEYGLYGFCMRLSYFSFCFFVICHDFILYNSPLRIAARFSCLLSLGAAKCLLRTCLLFRALSVFVGQD